MENLLGLLNRLGMARVAAMGVVVALLLGFFGFLIFRATTPQMAPLYSELTLDDSAAIVDELRSQNVSFELRGEGGTILVPRDQITNLRMVLAQDGLPTGGQVGYEIFDEQSTLGSTSFVQNINQVRALEGELARTIASLARVKSARVHLVLPERQLFRQDTPTPSASIVLAVRGELIAGEISAIQHLVSAAIEDLSPRRVSVVDDKGRLLASGSESDENMLVASDVQDRVAGMENRLENRVQSILENVVGAGRARVQVAVELDLLRSTQTTETFDPDGQVVRSSQVHETSSLSAGGENNAVSVSNELPNGTNTSGAQGSAGNQSTSTDETTNYEISKTTQTNVRDAGGVKRLSVAVAVDGAYQVEDNGASTYIPRSQEELDQLTALVRSAVGFDADRGDVIEVVNLQFAERPDLGTVGTDAPGLLDFTRDDLMNLANMGVTLIVALALLLFVLRPLLRRVLEPEAEPLTLPQPTADTQQGAPLTDQMQAEADGSGKPEWIDQAQQMGEAQMTTIKHVGELIEEHPRQAATIVRDWLNQAA